MTRTIDPRALHIYYDDDGGDGGVLRHRDSRVDDNNSGCYDDDDDDDDIGDSSSSCLVISLSEASLSTFPTVCTAPVLHDGPSLSSSTLSTPSTPVLSSRQEPPAVATGIVPESSLPLLTDTVTGPRGNDGDDGVVPTTSDVATRGRPLSTTTAVWCSGTMRFLVRWGIDVARWRTDIDALTRLVLCKRDMGPPCRRARDKDYQTARSVKRLLERKVGSAQMLRDPIRCTR